MAILTEQDYQRIRERFWTPEYKAILNAIPGGLPNKEQFRAGFQALEDVMAPDLTLDTVPLSSVHAYMERALDRALTTDAFMVLYRAWFDCRRLRGV